MKRFVLAIFGLVLPLLFQPHFTQAKQPENPAESPAKAKESPKVEWETNLRKLWDKSKELDQPMVVYVSMRGCHYCDLMKRNTWASADVQRELAGNYLTGAADRTEAENIVRQLNIRTFPTTIIMEPGGKLKQLVRGYESGVQMAQRLRKLRTQK